MKYDNKSFQERYEAWKNGADYWKDIRGVNLCGDAQEELSDEEKDLLDKRVSDILSEYSNGKDGHTIKKSPQLLYWEHMMSKGVDPAVAAGIAGNIQLESTFNHKASNGTHWGLVLTDRVLTDYIKKAYGNFSLDSQMNFLSDMALGTPRKIKHKGYDEALSRSKSFRGLSYKDAEDAANGWEVYFERSGGSSVRKRLKYAKLIYDKYNTVNKIPTAVELAEQNLNLSPIIINSPSTKSPGTINAAVPRSLIGPVVDLNAEDARNLVNKKLYELITTPTLPDVLNLLPLNNFGKDAYGLKFWQRRNNNLHFNKGKDGTSSEGIDRQEDKDQINWMYNWLMNRRDILQKNADVTTYSYSKYYPKDTKKPVGQMGWDRDDYWNLPNPLSYIKDSNPTRNRLNKIIYSLIDNAKNTPKVNVGDKYHPYYGTNGVYVEPNMWDNSGNYIAFNGVPRNDVKIHEFTHASHPTQQELYINDVIFKGKTPNVVDGHAKDSIDNAKELYGALQEFRYKNKLKPNQIINQKYINSHRKLFKDTYLLNISDKYKIRLFNEVAKNESLYNTFDNLRNFYA